MDCGPRLEALRGRLEEAGLEAMVVHGAPSIRYCSGFTGSAGVFVLDASSSWLLTDGRYRAQAREQLSRAGVPSALEVRPAAEQLELLAQLLRGHRRVGLEEHRVSWAAARAIAGRLPAVEIVPTSGLVERLRERKDASELARLSAAASVADSAFAVVVEQLSADVGRVREVDLARTFEQEVHRLGAEGLAFETIVASGPRGALPHGRATERVVGRSELVTVDFGARVDGYCSDATRTLSVGPVRDRVLAEVLDVVARSQRAGVAEVRAGRPASAVDAACRELIAEAGWGPAFVHGTGHGVGLEVHEAPAIARSSPDSLVCSSVVTVEPGIYLDGVGGARIEDTVVVADDGCSTLSAATRDLVLE